MNQFLEGAVIWFGVDVVSYFVGTAALNKFFPRLVIGLRLTRIILIFFGLLYAGIACARGLEAADFYAGMCLGTSAGHLVLLMGTFFLFSNAEEEVLNE